MFTATFLCGILRTRLSLSSTNKVKGLKMEVALGQVTLIALAESYKSPAPVCLCMEGVLGLEFQEFPRVRKLIEEN